MVLRYLSYCMTALFSRISRTIVWIGQAYPGFQSLIMEQSGFVNAPKAHRARSARCVGVIKSREIRCPFPLSFSILISSVAIILLSRSFQFL